jgi:hypothetical protein
LQGRLEVLSGLDQMNLQGQLVGQNGPQQLPIVPRGALVNEGNQLGNAVGRGHDGVIV